MSASGSPLQNTQSGFQWDGLRHFDLKKYHVFYNNTPAESVFNGKLVIHDPNDINHVCFKLGIRNHAKHGVCGHAVLLDLVDYYTAHGNGLPYDPWSPHALKVADPEARAKKERVSFIQGGILLREGFIQKYYASSSEER